MNAMAMSELVCSVFVAFSILGQFLTRDKSNSMKQIRIVSVLALVWLLSDALSYIFDGPGTNYYILYLLNLLAYIMSNVVFIGFLNYSFAYIKEKVYINNIFVAVPIAIMTLNTALEIVYFISGKIVEYKDGYMVAVGEFPAFLTIWFFVFLFYPTIFALVYRKRVGNRTVWLMIAYAIPSLVLLVIMLVTGKDYTVLTGATSTIFVVTLLQRDVTDYQMKAEAASLALYENNARVLAISDDFESLYDVDLITGHYELYEKNETSSSATSSNIRKTNDFFEDYIANAKGLIHPDSLEELVKALTRENIRAELEEKSHYEVFYKVINSGAEKWLKLRIVYKNETKHFIIIGVFNADEEIKEKLKEENIRKELINQMIGDDGLFIVDCVNNKGKALGEHSIVRGDDNDSYTEVFDRYIDAFVSDVDKKMMREVSRPQYMLDRVNKENEYSIIYRDLSAGLQRFYEMKIIKFSDTEVLQTFKEKDEEIINSLIFEKLEGEYFGLFVVDLESGLAQIMKDSPFYEIGKKGTITLYESSIKEFAKSVAKSGQEDIDDEVKEAFERISTIENIKKDFLTEDKATFVYHSPFVDGEKWVNVTELVLSRKEDGTPSFFALGFSVLDEYAASTHESQAQIKEDMQMIVGLAEEYQAVFYVNMDESSYKVYSLDDRFMNEVSDYFNGNLKGFDILRAYVDSENVHPNDQHLFAGIGSKAIRERLAHSKKFSIRFRRKVGERYIWFEMDVVKCEDIDERANILVIGFAARDKEIRLEQAQQQKLQDALEAAAAASNSKTSFLFNMSHDIRTPMNAITGFTMMAKKYIDDKEKVSEYLDKIDLAGDQLLSLINQVLEMARIESGKIDFDNKPVNIQEKFDAMVTVFSEQANVNGLEFNYDFKNIKHNNVFADEARMSSITLNIVGNAMKYTREGGKVNYTFEEIEPRKEGFATYVFTVSDTGIGMCEDYQKIIFEPFSREKNSTVSKIQGTGLGLSIVKNLVDLLGGVIELESELGKGTTFKITVDLKIDNDAKAKQEDSENVSAVTFDGRRVLVVEDNEMNREIAKDILEEYNFVVEEADDGDVAVDMVHAILERKDYKYYDFILMDIQMPKMDGYAATKEIRRISLPYDVHIPIIAMTANAFEEDRQNAFASGMDEHLAKPINIQKLLETLAKFLK